MRRAPLVLAPLGLLVLAGTAAGQTEEGNEYRVQLTLLPTHVVVATDDVVYLYGANASALRACLDSPTSSGFAGCPGLGDGDGTVEEEEVEGYERWFVRRLNREEGEAGESGPCEFSPGHTVRLDGEVRQPPCSNVVTRWNVREATGPVASMEFVWLDHTVVLYFPQTALALLEHEVSYGKSPDDRRDRTHNNRYVVRLVPGESWRLEPETVAPAWARERQAGNALVFTHEDDIEGRDATVTFTIRGPGDDEPPNTVPMEEDAEDAEDAAHPGVGLAVLAVALAAWLYAAPGRTG